MSLFEYLFDNEYKQRRDIERNEAATKALSANVGGELGALRFQVRELSMLVQVLVTMLADSGQLDVAEVKRRLAAELKAPVPAGVKEAACVRCGQKVPGDKLVKVGSDLWCRECAAHP